MFPRATLNMDGWTKVINSLAQQEVKVERWLGVPKETITEDEQLQLNKLAHTKLGTIGGGMKR